MSDENRSESPGTWLGEIEGHLWAMRPESLATLCQLAASGGLAEHVRTSSPEAAEAARRGRPRQITGGVTTIPLKGVLMPMTGFLAMLFGDMNPLDTFMSAMREAIADNDIGGIVMDVDSPGGVVDGIPEAAAEIRAMRGSKPIIAVTNTLNASAAYWISSQADEVVSTPSGATGSIGVYAAHRDLSGAMKLMGIQTTLISAGKFKTEGNPFQPLTDEARAAIQQDVDDYYAMFVADVAKGRGAKVAEVKAGYGEGRVLNAKRALAEKLIDRIETVGDAAARLASRGRAGLITRAEANAGAEDLETAEALAGATREREMARANFALDQQDDLAAAAS